MSADALNRLTEALPNGASTASEISAEQARQALDREKQVRTRACQEELSALLEKHHCKLDVTVLLRAGQVIPQLAVVALD